MKLNEKRRCWMNKIKINKHFARRLGPVVYTDVSSSVDYFIYTS